MWTFTGLSSRLLRGLKKRKRAILVVGTWALTISLIFIKVHWFVYLENPRYRVQKLALSYEGPQFDSMDLFLLGMVSIIAGIALTDVVHIFYGYLVSLGLSFSVSIVYTALYIWYVLGWGELLSLIPAGWEWAILWAILNVLWVMFPAAVMICLFGAIAGGVLRSWMKP